MDGWLFPFMITEIKPGSYRDPLVAGLNSTGQISVADEVSVGRIKLGITAQLRDSDRVLNLSDICIEALRTDAAKASASAAVLDYYINGLQTGSTSVCRPGGGQWSSNRHYAPGELFFKS